MKRLLRSTLRRLGHAICVASFLGFLTVSTAWAGPNAGQPLPPGAQNPNAGQNANAVQVFQPIDLSFIKPVHPLFRMCKDTPGCFEPADPVIDVLKHLRSRMPNPVIHAKPDQFNKAIPNVGFGPESPQQGSTGSVETIASSPFSHSSAPFRIVNVTSSNQRLRPVMLPHQSPPTLGDLNKEMEALGLSSDGTPTMDPEVATNATTREIVQGLTSDDLTPIGGDVPPGAAPIPETQAKEEPKELTAELTSARRKAEDLKKAADEARREAEEAKKTADAALQEAEEVQKAAYEARQKAEEAKKMADEARREAEATQKEFDDALKQSIEARREREAARKEAENAAKQAAEAQGTPEAEDAQRKAQQAWEKYERAFSKHQEAESKVQEAAEKAGRAKLPAILTQFVREREERAAKAEEEQAKQREADARKAEAEWKRQEENLARLADAQRKADREHEELRREAKEEKVKWEKRLKEINKRLDKLNKDLDSTMAEIIDSPNFTPNFRLGFGNVPRDIYDVPDSALPVDKSMYTNEDFLNILQSPRTLMIIMSPEIRLGEIDRQRSETKAEIDWLKNRIGELETAIR